VLSRLGTDDAERVVCLLQTIASTFPVLDAYNEAAKNVTPIAVKHDHEVILMRLRDIRLSGQFSKDPHIAVTQLAGIEPFDNIDDLKSLIETAWGETDATK
ncbi:MAG TPA: hypothetical protein P5280_01440, partial [Cyclobacteriaceae bacterium]|nr:hypothetical protein [Cyclobacteriaceae bacterium]